MTEYDSTQDTMEHINKVQVRIAEVQANLDQRAAVHDRSKLAEPEKAGYDILVGALAGNQYGTDAFKAAMQAANTDPRVKAAIQHHYDVSAHHPEHFENGIDGMSLLDVLELLCDWKGASERYGPSLLALAHNKERFGISDQLYAILENTVKELGW